MSMMIGWTGIILRLLNLNLMRVSWRPSSSLSSSWARRGSLPNCCVPASLPTSELGVEELQVMSLNGRGIFLADSYRGRLEESHLAKLACKAHVLYLQEVHGLRAVVGHSIGRLLPHWKVLYPPAVHTDGTRDPHSGGVAVLLCPILARVANLEVACSVPCRSLATSLKVRDKTVTVCNVHKYGLSLSTLRVIKDFLFMLSSNIELLPTSLLGIFGWGCQY